MTVNVTYLVGSRHEGYGETGMAHLLEHMLFKGTDKRKDIYDELRAHGANFNGSTYYDRTNYFETMPATDENLRFALELEADRMIHSRVSRDGPRQRNDRRAQRIRDGREQPAARPRRARHVHRLSVAQLRTQSRSARAAISNTCRSSACRPSITSIISPTTPCWSSPANSTTPRRWPGSRTSFGAIPKPTRKLIPTYTEEPTQDGEREVVLRRTGDIQAIMMAYHTPAGSHPDAATLEVLAAILGETPSGRLYKALVETKKAVAAVGGNSEFTIPACIEFSATVKKDGSLDDVEKTMLGVIAGVTKEPPSKDEVERAKGRLLKNIELVVQQLASRSPSS